MEFIEYQKLYEREIFHFWHVGRQEILGEALMRHLRSRVANKILDIGCGTGGNIFLLEKLGVVTGLDISEEALRLSKTRGFTNLILADATKMPFQNNANFDLVVCLDALEHIVADEKVIGEAFRVLNVGGLFLVTVPAHAWMWSPHDEALHHVRRYSKKEILSKLELGGFEIVEQSYFIMPALPINLFRKCWDSLFNKKVTKKKAYDMIFPHFLNYILLSMLRFEKFLLRYISLPFGTSIMVVARKPAVAMIKDFTESVACDLCGTKEHSSIYENKFTLADFSKNRTASFTYASPDSSRGAIVSCSNCNLVYMNPRDKDIASLYEGAEDPYYFSSKEDRHISFERDLKELHSVLNLSSGIGKKLLDVGCSYGFFMDVAQKQGWEVYGCELSKKQSAYASQIHKNVCNQPLGQCGFKENYFDVIVLYDVLEHVTSPSVFLKEAMRFLKKGGVVAITTPDFSSLSAYIMGRFWINLARMHLYYFTPNTIKKLFQKTGLEIIKSVRHKRVARLGVIIKWLSKFPRLYSVARIIFDNKFTRNIQFTSSLSGNMTVYAKKM